jgi:NAD(P)-dependent dehydrogenase (short-subunit alcohol dehydrogenase family)
MTTAFDGEVALVTGARGGIGLGTAEAFAKASASVDLADRDEEMIGKAAEGLRAAGHNTIGVICDVTDAAQVEAMIERAVSTKASDQRCLPGHDQHPDGSPRRASKKR